MPVILWNNAPPFHEMRMGAESLAAEPREAVMGVILIVSLFAVSFPTLSKQVPCLRIPAILFFIGKHFGTGVILATAFIHLLDDAFRSLQDPAVGARYGSLGKYCGLIILGSLLAIFLVEYVSTSYVDHIQDEPSAPPTPTGTPTGTPPPSRPTSPRSHSTLRAASRSQSSCRNLSDPTLSSHCQSSTSPRHRPTSAIPKLSRSHQQQEQQSPAVTETTPLLLAVHSTPEPPPTQSLDVPKHHPTQTHHYNYSPSHHTIHHHYHHHHHHHVYMAGVPIELLNNSPRIFRSGLSREPHGHAHACQFEHNLEPAPPSSGGTPESEDVNINQNHDTNQEHYPRIGRRRQVVGILVLQSGIMVHSFVIGLTLSVTHGTDFTSLTTAIIFHQLFEGLSLGIRIAALPANRKQKPTDERRGRRRLVSPGLSPGRLAAGDASLVGGEVESASSSWTAFERHGTTGANSSSSVIERCLDIKPRSPSRARKQTSFRISDLIPGEIHWLKPTLSILFGLTTPLGMGIGMTLWKSGSGSGAGSDPEMLLIQGVMSAISAGMLIYAATVEMIAGDFVFGDVDGGHGHGHGHGHGNGHGHGHGRHHHHEHHEHHEHHHTKSASQPPSNPQPQPPDQSSVHDLDVEPDAFVGTISEGHILGDATRELRREGGAFSHRSGGDHDGGRQGSTVQKKILAVVSLFAGVAGMVLIGLGE